MKSHRYSWSWGSRVVKDMFEDAPRATELTGKILGLTKIALIEMVTTDQAAWQNYKTARRTVKELIIEGSVDGNAWMTHRLIDAFWVILTQEHPQCASYWSLTREKFSPRLKERVVECAAPQGLHQQSLFPGGNP